MVPFRYDRLIRSAGRSQLSSDALMRSAVIYAGPLDDDVKAMECYSKVESEYPGTRNAEQAMYGRLALLMFAGKWDKAAELRKQFLKICKTERVRKSVDKVFGRMIACRSMKLKDEK